MISSNMTAKSTNHADAQPATQAALSSCCLCTKCQLVHSGNLASILLEDILLAGVLLASMRCQATTVF